MFTNWKNIYIYILLVRKLYLSSRKKKSKNMCRLCLIKKQNNIRYLSLGVLSCNDAVGANIGSLYRWHNHHMPERY